MGLPPRSGGVNAKRRRVGIAQHVARLERTRYGLGYDLAPWGTR